MTKLDELKTLQNNLSKLKSTTFENYLQCSDELNKLKDKIIIIEAYYEAKKQLIEKNKGMLSPNYPYRCDNDDYMQGFIRGALWNANQSEDILYSIEELADIIEEANGTCNKF